MKIYINHGDGGTYQITNDSDNREILVQTDWDYPGIAATFGWIPCDECRKTDGTVDCAHHTTSEMIASAAEYLDDCADYGKSVEDPGYFG